MRRSAAERQQATRALAPCTGALMIIELERRQSQSQRSHALPDPLHATRALTSVPMSRSDALPPHLCCCCPLRPPPWRLAVSARPRCTHRTAPPGRLPCHSDPRRACGRCEVL
jgi:hypothetical protein